MCVSPTDTSDVSSGFHGAYLRSYEDHDHKIRGIEDPRMGRPAACEDILAGTACALSIRTKVR